MKVKQKFTTNSRVIKELLTQYKDTFAALKELVNNSIQAKATKVELTLDYSDSATSKSAINKIEVKDNGIGVASTEFGKKILEIGTDIKSGGQGVGRFAALQLGDKMTIETVAYDDSKKKSTKVTFPLNASEIESSLSNVNLEYDVDDLKRRQNSYYKVVIEHLHHNKQEKVAKKNKLSDKFSEQNIGHALFELFPFEVFNNKLKFVINKKEIDPNSFVIGTPIKSDHTYTDKKGNEHEFNYTFFQVNSSLNKVKVFLCVDNAGITDIAHEYTYSSDWYTPDLGTWFIYVKSSFFDVDIFRNLDMDSLGHEEITKLKEFIKDTVNDFFKAKNKRYEKFVTQLENDVAYPNTFTTPLSKSRKLVFNKVAYIVEDEYKLLSKDAGLRTLLYKLIDRTLSSGYVGDIFNQLVHLSDDSMEKLHSLLQKTELENVISFSSLVANKLEFLDFLHELIYGDISAVLKERSQLHKIIERELWLFGEAYTGAPHLWSDKKIGNILDDLHKKYLSYDPSEDDDNLINHDIEGINNITDLFFYNERVLDNDEREVMVVELKSPSCSISRKEIQQIDDYAFTMEKYQGLPTEGTKYKLLLISSKLTEYAKSKLKSSREKYSVPFLYDIKSEKNIEIYIMSWAELISINRKKLQYLSHKLNVKDKKVKDKFEEEYEDIIDKKVASRLYKIK